MAINHKGPQFDPNVSLLQNYAQDQETWQQLAAALPMRMQQRYEAIVSRFAIPFNELYHQVFERYEDHLDYGRWPLNNNLFTALEFNTLMTMRQHLGTFTDGDVYRELEEFNTLEPKDHKMRHFVANECNLLLTSEFLHALVMCLCNDQRDVIKNTLLAKNPNLLPSEFSTEAVRNTYVWQLAIFTYSIVAHELFTYQRHDLRLQFVLGLLYSELGMANEAKRLLSSACRRYKQLKLYKPRNLARYCQELSQDPYACMEGQAALNGAIKTIIKGDFKLIVDALDNAELYQQVKLKQQELQKQLSKLSQSELAHIHEFSLLDLFPELTASPEAATQALEHVSADFIKSRLQQQLEVLHAAAAAKTADAADTAEAGEIADAGEAADSTGAHALTDEQQQALAALNERLAQIKKVPHQNLCQPCPVGDDFAKKDLMEMQIYSRSEIDQVMYLEYAQLYTIAMGKIYQGKESLLWRNELSQLLMVPPQSNLVNEGKVYQHLQQGMQQAQLLSPEGFVTKAEELEHLELEPELKDALNTIRQDLLRPDVAWSEHLQDLLASLPEPAPAPEADAAAQQEDLSEQQEHFFPSAESWHSLVKLHGGSNMSLAQRIYEDMNAVSYWRYTDAAALANNSQQKTLEWSVFDAQYLIIEALFAEMGEWDMLNEAINVYNSKQEQDPSEFGIPTLLNQKNAFRGGISILSPVSAWVYDYIFRSTKARLMPLYIDIERNFNLRMPLLYNIVKNNLILNSLSNDRLANNPFAALDSLPLTSLYYMYDIDPDVDISATNPALIKANQLSEFFNNKYEKFGRYINQLRDCDSLVSQEAVDKQWKLFSLVSYYIKKKIASAPTALTDVEQLRNLMALLFDSATKCFFQASFLSFVGEEYIPICKDYYFNPAQFFLSQDYQSTYRSLLNNAEINPEYKKYYSGLHRLKNKKLDLTQSRMFLVLEEEDGPDNAYAAPNVRAPYALLTVPEHLLFTPNRYQSPVEVSTQPQSLCLQLLKVQTVDPLVKRLNNLMYTINDVQNSTINITKCTREELLSLVNDLSSKTLKDLNTDLDDIDRETLALTDALSKASYYRLIPRFKVYVYIPELDGNPLGELVDCTFVPHGAKDQADPEFLRLVPWLRQIWQLFCSFLGNDIARWCVSRMYLVGSQDKYSEIKRQHSHISFSDIILKISTILENSTIENSADVSNADKHQHLLNIFFSALAEADLTVERHKQDNGIQCDKKHLALEIKMSNDDQAQTQIVGGLPFNVNLVWRGLTGLQINVGNFSSLTRQFTYSVNPLAFGFAPQLLAPSISRWRLDVIYGCSTCLPLVQEYYDGILQQHLHLQQLHKDQAAAHYKERFFSQCVNKEQLNATQNQGAVRMREMLGKQVQAQGAADPTEIAQQSMRSSAIGEMSEREMQNSMSYLSNVGAQAGFAILPLPEVLKVPYDAKIWEQEGADQSVLVGTQVEQLFSEQQMDLLSKLDQDIRAYLKEDPASRPMPAIAEYTGFAVGTSCLYLDFLIWDLNRFKELLRDLRNLPILHTLQCGEMYYHSFNVQDELHLL